MRKYKREKSLVKRNLLKLLNKFLKLLHIVMQIILFIGKSFKVRDIKPENIMIDSRDGTFIKLIDFGTSQLFTNAKMLEFPIGTSYYIAPEILSLSYNQKCDIWSIGVILYLLLSGKFPFDGENE